MNAQELQSLLQNHSMGDKPFKKVFGINAPDYYRSMGQMAHDLIKYGVVAARWDSTAGNHPINGVWREYLVLTLAARPFPQELGEQSIALSHNPWTLQQIHDVALRICGCHFYMLKGSELWLEYKAASAQAEAEMKAVLATGLVGDIRFPVYLRMTRPPWFSHGMQAYRLALYGISKVRWETPAPPYVGYPEWNTALVATLPPSSFAAPPGLPSHDLLSSILVQIEAPLEYDIRVKDEAVEMWIWYRLTIPRTEEEKQHLQAMVDEAEMGEHGPA